MGHSTPRGNESPKRQEGKNGIARAFSSCVRHSSDSTRQSLEKRYFENDGSGRQVYTLEVSLKDGDLTPPQCIVFIFSPV